MKNKHLILSILMLSSIMMCTPSFCDESTKEGIKADTGTSGSTSETFPQIDISGYKQYVSKITNLDNISAESLLPKDSPSGDTWREYLKLGIAGRLTKDLDVYYDLRQKPGNAEHFNVNVAYYNYSIKLGNLNDSYRSEYFSQCGNSGVILSGTLWSVTPFIVASAATHPPYSDKSGNYVNLSYGYRDPGYYGSEVFPAFMNYENEHDRDYWLFSNKYLGARAFMRPRPDPLDVKADQKKLFLIDDQIYFASEKVYMDKQRRFRTIDYGIDYTRGDIILNQGMQAYSEIQVDYPAIVSDRKYNSSGGGFSWKANNENTVSIGYLDNIAPEAKFSTLNLSHNWLIDEDSQLIWEVDQSQYVADITREAGTAYSISYKKNVGDIDYCIRGSHMDKGFASSSLTELGIDRGYSEIAGTCGYNISDAGVFEGPIKIGFASIDDITGEARSGDLTKAYVLEGDNTLFGWLGQYNRYQHVESYQQNFPNSVMNTYSLLNISSINLDQHYAYLDEPSKVYIKNLAETQGWGTIKQESADVELGTLVSLKPYSILLNRNFSNSTADIATTEAGYYIRGTYSPFNNTSLYIDCSSRDGKYINDYTMMISGFGIIIDIPMNELALLSDIYLGFGTRYIIYTDYTDPSNDYRATELRFNGTINF